MKRPLCPIAVLLILSLMGTGCASRARQTREPVVTRIELTLESPSAHVELMVEPYRLTHIWAAPGAGVSHQVQVATLGIVEFQALHDVVVAKDFCAWDGKAFGERSGADTATYTVRVTYRDPWTSPTMVGDVCTASCQGQCPQGMAQIVDRMKRLRSQKGFDIGY